MEEADLLREERLLSFEAKRIELDERRLQLEQRRASLQLPDANTTHSILLPHVNPIVSAGASLDPRPLAEPKILTANELKKIRIEQTAKKAPPCIGPFLKMVIPQDGNVGEVINNPDARNTACNDANAVRAKVVVNSMEHETMRKRKAEPMRDNGTNARGVKDGKLVRTTPGIDVTEKTALLNIKKFIPAPERNEYSYDRVAKRIFCKPCTILIARVEYLNPKIPTSCHHLTKQHNENRKKCIEANAYQQSLTTVVREKQHNKTLTTQITDTNFQFRTEVTRCLMQAGIHLEVLASKNAPMRRLLDKYVSVPSNFKYRLTDASHLRKTHIPLVQEVELLEIKKELKESEGWIGLSFDETTKHRLWWSAVFRFVHKAVMLRRVVRLASYKHGPDELVGRQLSFMVIDVLETWGIPRKRLLHLGRDGVAINGAATR